MKILVVDDYATMRRIIRNQLDQIGHKDVADAADGEEALKKLRAERFDLIISDWNMEPMTGFDLLKQVRADAKLKAIPFIMVAAESKAENVAAAKSAGMDDYIAKPFNAATLRQRIDAALLANAS